MARARNIKPGFFTNDELVELPFEVRLLFIGLWTIADKEGRLSDRPKKIKMEIFPADSVDCDAGLTLLDAKGFIKRYSVQGVAYIKVLNWSRHQNPHIKEAPSQIPDEEVQAPEIPEQAPEIPEQAPEIQEQAGLILDSLNLIPDSLQSDSKTTAQKPRLDYQLDAFDDFWATYPNRPGSSKADSLKAWKSRIKEGANPADMIDGAAKYSAYCVATSIEPQYIKQPVTFLGVGKHYASDWTPPARAAPKMSIHDQRAETIAILTGRKTNERTSNEHDITGESFRVA